MPDYNYCSLILQIMAAPFAVGALSVDPPGAFGFLMVYYFLAETWFAILFTVLVEIVPNEVRSVCIGWRTVVELPVKTRLNMLFSV